MQKGDKVFLQNLVGNHPRRWERTGTILECKEFDQYIVKVDGTGRMTLRNRKHLRSYTPIPRAPRDTFIVDAETHHAPMDQPKETYTYTMPTSDNPADPLIPSHAEDTSPVPVVPTPVVVVVVVR